MKTIEIECTNNNMTKTVDVLQENDKYMKVAIQGTQITLELFREDVNMSYPIACVGGDLLLVAVGEVSEYSWI